MQDQVGVVMGAGSARGARPGVGAATAVTLAAQGASVVVVDINEERAAETCALVIEQGGRAIPVIADASSASDCNTVVSRTLHEFGRLDMLVNNATTVFSKPLLECTDEDWDRVMKVNAASVFFACRAAIPAMIDGGGGSIVSITTLGVYRGFGTSVYAASKGTIEALTKDIAFSYGAQGIRANVVAPGHLESTISANLDHPTAGLSDDLRRKATLLETVGTGQDVAEMTAFLLSAKARWITAVTVPVDAGSLAAAPFPMFARVRNLG